jgi:hypothetical protein
VARDARGGGLAIAEPVPFEYNPDRSKPEEDRGRSLWPRDADLTGRLLILGALLFLAALLVFVALVPMSDHHHNVLVAHFSGTWASRTDPRSRLTIVEDMRTVPDGSERPTGYLRLGGTIAGRAVGAMVGCSGWALWSSKLHTALAGRPWTLSVDRRAQVLTMTDGPGHVVVFDRTGPPDF